jgi:DNA mismatch repair protein MutS
MSNTEFQTPMMRQYWEIKKKYKNELVFYRLGDFYELFMDDAEIASKILDITLTKRNKSSDIKMAGIPHHAAESYISRLVQKGYSVVICEQVGEVEKAKLVERKVSRVFTPGTITDENIIDPKSDNDLIAVNFEDEKFGLARINVSTGDFVIYTFDTIDALIIEIEKIEPAEILIPENFFVRSLFDNKKSVKELPEECFNVNTAIKVLKDKKIISKDCQNNKEIKAAIGSSLAVIKHIENTQGRFISYAKEILLNNEKDFLKLDWVTRKNLDLMKSSYDDNEDNSLFSIINNTETSMGSRLLKRIIKNPLTDKSKINNRLDIVEELSKTQLLNSQIKENLADIFDIERIVNRISIKTAKPRDLHNLKESLIAVRTMKENLSNKVNIEIFERLETAPDIVSFIERAIIDEPPVLVKDGGVVKEKYNKELDDLRYLAENSHDLLFELEKNEQEKNNMPSLRISFNKVSGYYIELPKGQAKKAPEHFIRKQTLKNVERYTTSDLMDFEHKAITAKVKSIAKEKEIYEEIVELMGDYIQRLKIISDVLAELDIITSFAENVQKFNLKRPTFGSQLKIDDGRHLVIEVLNDRNFTPNNLDMTEHNLLLVTGPNMGGKSTYMRQNALIIILAHIGSFVPATYCEIPAIDRIFSRIGASDNLAEGVSTFMMEMQETSNILQNATKNSFVIIDEIGRGTSTYDGLSLAWAIAEDLERIGCKTLFSTHYFELVELAELKSKIHNVHMDSEIKNGEIIFIHKVKDGSVDQSYGLHVAKLAGIEANVLKNAEKKLNELKSIHNNDIKERLSAKIIDLGKELNSLTPIEALNIINELLN